MRAFVALIVGYGQALIAALQFLTRLPIPIRFEYTETVCRRSVIFYPLVGAVIGLLLCLAGEGLRQLLPALPAAGLMLVLWIILTGGLHLDGLMDTADGILSHRPREQMLEIMKDSRVGAMGVIACVLLLLMKFSLLYTLLSSESWRGASVLFLGVPVWSRWFMVVAMQGWPYARRESGMGSYYRGLRKGHVFASLILGIVLTIIAFHVGINLPYEAHMGSSLTGGILAQDFILRWPEWLYTLGFVIVTFGFGFAISVYLARKLGGLTGDTYGALNELLETILLLVLILVI